MIDVILYACEKNGWDNLRISEYVKTALDSKMGPTWQVYIVRF